MCIAVRIAESLASALVHNQQRTSFALYSPMRRAIFTCMKRYSVYVTPVCDGGSKLMVDVDLVRFAVVVDGGTAAFSCSYDSWAKLRMELLRANVLSPAYLSQAEDKFYRGESWRSPDTVPMTDEQMKEMKLKRQPDPKAISA